VKVVIGTAVLTLVVALDGDGATTYMVTVSALLPLYARLGMNTLIMACIIMMSTSVMNVLPWGGPAGRVASALGVEMGDLFIAMIPAMLGSGLGVMLIAYRLGLVERRRLGTLPGPRSALAEPLPLAASAEETAAETGERRPQLLWVNLVLTLLLMSALLASVLPLSVLFMIAFAIAMMINYPSLDEQKARIAAHAGNALAVSGLIFAAGIFTGVLAGTGMVDAMANAVVSFVPTSLGPYMAVVAGLLSIPGTFFISYDAFYFGVMPVIAKAGAAYGIDAAEIARASLIGAPVHALSPLTASTYLLIGLSRIELGDHQRFSLRWTLAVSLLMLALLVVTGAVPLTAER
jgi:CitMHS family citrate-Mg2+:H+ or citrate-Ca2+:H+ symporter